MMLFIHLDFVSYRGSQEGYKNQKKPIKKQLIYLILIFQ